MDISKATIRREAQYRELLHYQWCEAKARHRALLAARRTYRQSLIADDIVPPQTDDGRLRTMRVWGRLWLRSLRRWRIGRMERAAVKVTP